MRWGDKIPYESATVVPAVGNSANAAVAAARLGLSSGLRAYVGADQYGQECLASLVARQGGHDVYREDRRANTPTTTTCCGTSDNRTILVKHEMFDYTVPPMA